MQESMASDFKYDVGMYGGCFDPLHQGHLYTIERAASECKELWLVLSWSLTRDHIEWKTRISHLKRAANCYSNVKVLGVEDKCRTKAEYNAGNNWLEGSKCIKGAIGKHIDVVYCSDEYDTEDSPYKRCYPDSRLVFIPRDRYRCSSSEIREDPFKWWDYIPSFVRPSYVKTVLLVGHESTGKTTLCRALSSLFNTKCVLEYGREVCERAGGEQYMTEADFAEIVFQHSLDILRGRREANKILFVDTDQFITSLFAAQNGVVGIASQFELIQRLRPKFDLTLFLEPDVSFIQDGLRNEIRNGIDARKEYSDYILKIYRKFAPDDDLMVVSGGYYERLEKCIKLVKERWPSV